MNTIINIVSAVLILFGVVHISRCFSFHINIDTLWFVGAGIAIIFAGLLNLVAIDRGGSKFTIVVAVVVNAFNCAMCCFALQILNIPQIYVGITIFAITTICFSVLLFKKISN